MAGEDVEGLIGCETESGESAGITVRLKNGLPLDFLETDAAGVSCGFAEGPM